MGIYKSILVFLFLMLIKTAAFSQKSTDDFSGKWKTAEGGIIEISRKESGFIGVGVLKKFVVLKDLQFKDGKWVSEMTNPAKNQTANCELLLEVNRIKIIARKGFFSKTIYWTKL
jgi:uncharacterized protein (DUF2147 family)